LNSLAFISIEGYRQNLTNKATLDCSFPEKVIWQLCHIRFSFHFWDWL